MWRWRKHNRLSKPPNLTTLPESSKETGSSSPKRPLLRQFTIAQIRSATEDFNESLLIGRVSNGDYYKGTIENGTIVAIKRWTSALTMGPREFQATVGSLSVLQHSNIVCLIGYCNDGKEKIIVYEYMSNGSLEEHLHKHHTPLSWPQRLKICIDVARALHYLHNECRIFVLHGNVNSSDILLDNNRAAKIKYFGLSEITPESSSFFSTPLSTPRIAFSAGYVDPEYLATGRLSNKSDVYSFGVVLLEVICRRRAFDRNLDEEQWALVSWAHDYLKKGTLEKIIDPDLRGQIPTKCLNEFAKLVEGCLHKRQKERITMGMVVSGLESILAFQERIDNLLPQMSKTTFGRRLQASFFSSSQNYGGSYSKKYTELLSANETISNYIQRADVLMRMKDFLHLIWCYPVKKEAVVDFRSLVDKCSSLNEYIRKSLDSPSDKDYPMEIQTLLRDIEDHINEAAFDMVAYLPQDFVQNRPRSVLLKNQTTWPNSGEDPFTKFWLGVPEVHASAISSAINRAVSCIKDLKVKKLGISGSGADEVAETLKVMPELKRAFDMVLCVHVEHHSMNELLSEIEKEMHIWKERSPETSNLDQFQSCLLFIDVGEIFIDLHDPDFSLSKWFGTVQMVMTSKLRNADCPVDMKIRVEDHLLPWILFSMNVDQKTVGKNSSIQPMETRLIEKFHGHLLAIVLLARALRGVLDVSTWGVALQELESSSSELDIMSDVMVRVLKFIWSRMESLSQRCIIQFASCYVEEEFDKFSVINNWIRDGTVKDEKDGVDAFEDLMRCFLLEGVGDNCVRMRDEIRVILLAYFVPRVYGLYLKKDGSESNIMPNIEGWDALEIHLSNNILLELPDKPDCPILVNLFLHSNQDLMDIPTTFFDNMPSLQVLDLSGTSIKCLPSSISKLTTLQKLFIRDCALLMELPPEIGALKNLKVLDAEGTQLLCLPKQIGPLIKLECLKFSLYNFADKHKRSNQSMKIIHAEVLSKLRWLKELSICVDLYGEWWEDEVKLIIDILPKVWNLESLRLYFPTTKLLKIFMETDNRIGVPIYQNLSNFGFIVGHLRERVISRVPHDVYKTFIKMPKCLTYTNGEGDTEVIGRVLTGANALFLDRHWTVRSLSAFGLAEMKRLKFCLLAECNEMLEIVNGSHFNDPSIRPVLGLLEHISIHYMKSLTCILNRPIDCACMPNLKTLAIHTCPELRTIFTQGLLDSLTCLEYLIVEDCTMIDSLVSLESYRSTSTPCLPSLKKISLLHLHGLVSISRGISIAPRLESLVVYDCPNLEKLSYMEDSDDLKEIRGENEWWDALKWCEPEWTSGQPDYLARVFMPLGTNGDIMDKLADAVNLLPHLGIGDSTKEAQTVQVITRPGPTDKGKGKI